MKQPIPELGHALDLVEVSCGVDQNVRIEEVQHHRPVS
jgi:hypothetical protein